MTPLMYSSTPGVVNRRSRYARRFSSVDSSPIESNRFLIVPVLSSAARIPFPSATSALAVSCSSWWPMRLSRSDSVPKRYRPRASPETGSPGSGSHSTPVRLPSRMTGAATPRLRPWQMRCRMGRKLAGERRSEHGQAYGHRHLGRFAEFPLACHRRQELGPLERLEHRRRRRRHGCRSRHVAQQCDLPDEVAGAESRDLAAVLRHLDRAGLDHVEAIALVALANDDPSGPDLDRN